jgi:hypothetical protein
VQKILANRIYTGVRLLGKDPRGKHARVQDGRAVPVEEPDAALSDTAGTPALAEGVIRIAGAAPVLIAEEAWQAVQKRLRGGRHRSYRAGLEPLPLSGLGRCGHCGSPLHVARSADKRGRPTKRIYCGLRYLHGKAHCPEGGRTSCHDRVLAIVLATLAEHLLDQDAVDRLAERVRSEGERAVAQQDALRDNLARQMTENAQHIEQGRRRLATAPDDLVEDYQASLRDLKARRAELEAALQALDREQLASPDRLASEEKLLAWLEACRRLCQPGARAQTAGDGTGEGIFNKLLCELLAGFRLYWREEKLRPGYRELDHVEVDLPEWLTALLATSATHWQSAPRQDHFATLYSVFSGRANSFACMRRSRVRPRV